jgi:5-hydroxyisourate hydrolase
MDDGSAEPVFNASSGPDGRITGEIPIDEKDPGREYELVFHTGAYFDEVGPEESDRITRTVVFRLYLPDAHAKYHVPVIASPHGYSVWWSALT